MIVRVNVHKAFYGALQYDTCSSDDTELLPTDPFTDPPTPNEAIPPPAPISADTESVTDSSDSDSNSSEPSDDYDLPRPFWAAVVAVLFGEKKKKKKVSNRSFPEEGSCL
jgi:hypothetical protein